ncbi:ARID/BRIGHT DNA binding domain containing protein [Brugia malayi]|uniref:ARID/BRIGHT DNA binding domain containing protein n=2 Tax=Brugia TaxID=6278 RepID=A0A4E9FIZ4_BRUMA|nr:ARID/BRIGHT DNA binding domain containing protein [Brugia malayi]VIO93122.1 ARID/BRIGHT DNA binding domain containing protein [Brugia malayi]
MERRKRKSSVEEYLDRLMENPEKVQRCSEFHMNLRTFYKKRWNCRLKSPHIQGVEVDLFRLYDTVISMGGWQKVSFNEKWGDIAHAIGLANGVAVAEHAIKVLYMRYLSKYEQNELVGEVDDADSDLLSSRSRGKGFSSLATADCPISTGQRQASEYFRLRPEKKEAEYDRIVKSLLSGLPNEVDFAVNVCTLLSHPGPRVLRLVAAPQIITLLVAHLAIFPDGDRAFYDLYKSWELVSGHNFIAFWSGAGITDDEVLKLIPHIKPSMVSEEESNIFCGLDTEFQPRNVVSWRVQQVLLIIRNLSFEVINKAVLAASWPLLKFLFICSNCKWSMLRTAALDALSNIACEIDLMAEESSSTNHLLLKTVSCCLHSDDKFRVIRALEILSGLCNNERNESLICEFLDHRILSKIFTVISVKDIMMCVYTLESLYQISELGATACYQLSRFPHAIDTLVSLATVEAVSFGPSGLIGMKVVEFHGPSQLAPPPPQNVPISQNQAVRPGSFATPTHSTSYSSRMVTPRGTSNTSTPVIGDSKVEQLTAKWIRMNCVFEMGSVVPRGELYASYVDDLRHRYGALSGSVQTFTNIMRAVYPNVILRVQSSSGNHMPVFENIRMCRMNPNIGHENLTVSTNTDSHASLVANHPLVQKMLTDNANSPAILNGHTTVTVVATAAAIDKKSMNETANNTMVSTSYLAEDATRPGSSHVSNVQPSTSLSIGQQVCRVAIEAHDFVPEQRHETKILRIENASRTVINTVDEKHVPQMHNQLQSKSVVARRINGICDNRIINSESVANGFDSELAHSSENTVSQTLNGTPTFSGLKEAKPIVNVAKVSVDTQMVHPSTSAMGSTRDDDCDSLKSYTSSTPCSPISMKRRRVSACSSSRPTTSSIDGDDYLCEWNGCGKHFSSASFVLYHCTKEHVGDDHSIQCHWPRCDSTVRAKWSMVTHLQDHHCNEAALKAAAKRRKEGHGLPLGPVNPERPREIVQHPGYSKNAAVEAIRRHAFNYLPRDITDDPEGPVTKSIRLTSCLILRNLARYSNDGRRLLRRHERLLSWLSLSRVESSSALAQLLAELYSQPSSSSSPFCSSSSLSPHRTYHVPTALNAVTLAKAL